MSSLITSFRLLWRNRFSTIVHIAGLSVGIASCVFIFMFVQNELSFDRHHEKKDRIYRLVCDLSLGGEDDKSGMSSFMLSPTLKNDYPEVEEAVRVMPLGKQMMWVDDQPYQFNDNIMSDDGFFSIFDYTFIEGDPNTALKEPQSVVITDEVANKLFGTSTGLVGKMIRYARQSYKITGVIKDEKDRSHLYFNTIISISSLQPQFENTLKNDWFYLAQTNYVLFRNESDAATFETKLAQLRDKYIIPWLKQVNSEGKITYRLQPLTSIHLSNEYPTGYARTGNRSYIYIFSLLAIFILVIACINYVNLSVATAGKRSKEIGIRKTAGATAQSLFRQFITESLLIVMQAVILALIWVHLLLPLFNSITEKTLHVPYSLPGLACLLALILIIGFAAGSYPALYLSRMQPALVLKSNKLPGGLSVWLRKSLVVIQFFIAVSFIICTIVIYTQMHFMKNKSMGFNKDQVLVVNVPVADTSFAGKYEALKQELLGNPHIKQIAASSSIPGVPSGQLIHVVETPDHQSQEKAINFMMVSPDFIPLMEMKVNTGRNFSDDMGTDQTGAFIVNESAVKVYGWKDPLNYSLENGFGYKGKIIGVVNDFNYQSLHEPVQPLVMMLGGKLQGYLLVKINSGNEQDVISYIEKTWSNYSKRYPFDYFFMDDNFDKLYRTEDRMLKLFTAFSIISLLISCLGLYALVTYSLEQRIKEIGIRKVMGASVATIVITILKEYMLLVSLALCCAIPLSAYFMHRWLSDFAYRAELPVWIFLLGGFTCIIIAGATICFRTVKAAMVNPVKSLRYE